MSGSGGSDLAGGREGGPGRELGSFRRLDFELGERGGTLLVAFSVTPIGTGEGVGEAVAEAVRVVRDSGLPNRTDAMFTTIEGEWDEVMAVVKQAVDAVAARAPRVSMTLKADVRAGVTDGLTAKADHMERHLHGGA